MDNDGDGVAEPAPKRLCSITHHRCEHDLDTEPADSLSQWPRILGQSTQSFEAMMSFVDTLYANASREHGNDSNTHRRLFLQCHEGFVDESARIPVRQPEPNKKSFVAVNGGDVVNPVTMLLMGPYALSNPWDVFAVYRIQRAADWLKAMNIRAEPVEWRLESPTSRVFWIHVKRSYYLTRSSFKRATHSGLFDLDAAKMVHTPTFSVNHSSDKAFALALYMLVILAAFDHDPNDPILPTPALFKRIRCDNVYRCPTLHEWFDVDVMPVAKDRCAPVQWTSWHCAVSDDEPDKAAFIQKMESLASSDKIMYQSSITGCVVDLTCANLLRLLMTQQRYSIAQRLRLSSTTANHGDLVSQEGQETDYYSDSACSMSYRTTAKHLQSFDHVHGLLVAAMPRLAVEIERLPHPLIGCSVTSGQYGWLYIARLSTARVAVKFLESDNDMLPFDYRSCFATPLRRVLSLGGVRCVVNDDKENGCWTAPMTEEEHAAFVSENQQALLDVEAYPKRGTSHFVHVGDIVLIYSQSITRRQSFDSSQSLLTTYDMVDSTKHVPIAIGLVVGHDHMYWSKVFSVPFEREISRSVGEVGDERPISAKNTNSHLNDTMALLVDESSGRYCRPYHVLDTEKKVYKEHIPPLRLLQEALQDAFLPRARNV